MDTGVSGRGREGERRRFTDVRAGLYLLLLMGACAGATAQTATVRYANDFFAGTDVYFTQGIYVGVDGPRRGFFLGQEGSTPTDLSDPGLRPRDHPYAGTLYGGMRGRLWGDRAPEGRTWTYDVLLGLIGPAAKGEEQQTAIHRAIDDEVPLGWRHQVGNALLLDVGLGLRQNLLDRRHLALDALADARLGTFRTRLGAGAEVRAGWAGVVGFAKARTFLVGYDASLQGGLGRRDAHAFTFGEVRHVRGRLELGVRVRVGRLGLSYGRAFETRSFVGARRHGWGTVGLTVLAKAAPRSLVAVAGERWYREW